MNPDRKKSRSPSDGVRTARVTASHTDSVGVRLLWTRTPTESVWLAVTRAVRTPSDGERDFFLSGFIGFSQGLPFFARFNANRTFHSEQLNGYELGARKL